MHDFLIIAHCNKDMDYILKLNIYTMYNLFINLFCIFRYTQEIEALSITVISDRTCVPNTKI